MSVGRSKNVLMKVLSLQNLEEMASQLIENGVRDGDSVSRPVMEFIPEADQSKAQTSS